METYAALRTRLRTRLDELTAHRWLDADLLQKLYDGAKDVARKSESLRKTSTIAGVAGTQSYTGPTDLIRVHRVTWKYASSPNVYPLEYRDFMSMDAVWWTQQTVAQQTPALFTMWGSPPALQLVLYPTPEAAGTITVYYYNLPADPATVASVTCELPQGWEDCAIDYATYMCLLEDRDPMWQTHKALYEEHMSDLTITAQRFSDQAGMIVPDGGVGAVPRFIWDENY